MKNTNQNKLYEVVLATGETLSVEVTGDYRDPGVKDLSASISCDGVEIAVGDFDECCDSSDVTDWVADSGFLFANAHAAEIAECVIQSALIDASETVGEAVSRKAVELDAK